MKKLLFPILFFCSSFLFGQQLRLDTNIIRIGEQISLNITVEIEANEKITWPTFNDTITKGIEIIQIGKIVSLETNNELTLSQNFIITAFDSGVYYISPIVLSENKKTEGFVLNVQTIDIGEDAKIKDIKANIDAPYGWGDIWPYLVTILLLGLIYLLIKKYIFNKKEK